MSAIRTRRVIERSRGVGGGNECKGSRAAG